MAETPPTEELPENVVPYSDRRNKINKAVGQIDKFITENWHEYIWPIGSLVGMLRPIHHWLIGKVANIQEGQKVLEIGSGYPLYQIYADKVGSTGIFVALDINQNIQKRSRKIGYWVESVLKRKDPEKSPVIPITGNAERLPFDDSTFDTVIASNFTGGKGNSSEVFRTLKPGGRVIYTFNEFLSVPIVTASQAKDCKKLGFTDVKVRPGAPGHFVPGANWNWYVEAKKPELRQLE